MSKRASERQVVVEDPQDEHPEGVLMGSMTIDFWDIDGQINPEVTFNPVGRISAATLHRFQEYFYRRINEAQAEARRAAA